MVRMLSSLHSNFMIKHSHPKKSHITTQSKKNDLAYRRWGIMSDSIKLGNTDIPFVFRGDELMYPNYVKDGLVLHYDFSGMSNSDESRGVAKDLSGNGNDGTLQNFNFTEESGYDKNKLIFDGVDDEIGFTDVISEQTTENQRWSVEFVGHVNSLS